MKAFATFPKDGAHPRLVLGSQEILFVSPDPDSASDCDMLIFSGFYSLTGKTDGSPLGWHCR